ncbi:hypothetical protein IJ670_02720 [bacterium]|nr:hypothetical protein [bacterium]
MENILIKFIKSHYKCAHKHALLNSDVGYCPDCGEFLVKNYYLVRCARCDIKREAKIFFGQVMPQDKFCSNCGSSEYYVEKIDKINFVDASWAVYLKEIADDISNLHPEAQIWVEEGNVVKQIEGKN